jgi:hypothetical protein
MPESLHLPPVAQGVAAITAVALAVVRLLTASRPFWDKFPTWLQKGAPVALMALAAVPVAIEHARSWFDVVVALVVSGGMYYTASRGDKRPPADSKPVAAKPSSPHVFLQNEDGSPIEMRTWPVPALGVLALLACLVLPTVTGCGASAWQAQRDAADVVAGVANDTVEPALLAAYRSTGLLVVRAQHTQEDAQVALSLHQERWKPVWHAWAGFVAAHQAWQNQIEAKGDPLPAAMAARKSFCELRELAKGDWDVELPNFPGPLACTAVSR